MRNYLLAAFIATSATLTSQPHGFRPEVLLSTTEVIAGSLEEAMVTSRENLARLAKNDPLVLQRFDQLVANLSGLDENHVKQILKAVDFAAEKHQFQTRKNEAKTPYISHPIGVTNHVIIIGKVTDPAVIIAALLHDTLEDTETTFEEITQQFGEEVAGYVRELTHDKKLSIVERKRLQVINAPKKSLGAAQIKLADKLYNLTDLLKSAPQDWSRDRVDQYFEWSESVINRLPAANPELKQAVEQLINEYWESQGKASVNK